MFISIIKSSNPLLMDAKYFEETKQYASAHEYLDDDEKSFRQYVEPRPILCNRVLIGNNNMFGSRAFTCIAKLPFISLTLTMTGDELFRAQQIDYHGKVLKQNL